MTTKAQAMEQVVAAIQRQWGTQALRRLEGAAAAQPSIPTGSPALDRLLGRDGLPRGVVAWLSGRPTSGAATLALDVIVQAQARGEVTIYLDAERTLDPEYAVRRGVDLARLLVVWARPRALGFEMARDMVLAGGAGIIVFHLGNSQGGAGPSAGPALRRLAALLPRTAYSVLCLSPLSDASLTAYAGLHLRLERLRWLREGEQFQGYEVQVTVLKNKFAPAGQSVTLTVRPADKRPRA